MEQLQFPAYSFRLKNSKNKLHIFCSIRKKFLILTPEEWVRQHVIAFLIETKNYPKSLINVERQIQIGPVSKRYDIVIYKSDGTLQLIVECKAPKVAITQETFDQIARYNLGLQADLLMVTNGLSHYYCTLDYEHSCYYFLKDLPSFEKP